MLNYQRVEPGDFSEAIRICVAFCVANGSKCYTIVKEPFPPLDGTSMNPIDFEQPGLFRFLAYHPFPPRWFLAAQPFHLVQPGDDE